MCNFSCGGTACWDRAAVPGLHQYGAFYFGGNVVSLHRLVRAVQWVEVGKLMVWLTVIRPGRGRPNARAAPRNTGHLP